MTHDGELCAALPLTQASMAVWYCHAHMGYCWSTRIHDQTTDEVIATVHAHDGDLGPFDDPDALLVMFAGLMEQMRRHVESRTL